ncbi:hypothetical protein Ctob_011896 [Chrysochromulina tobinii]|uniref:Uncharacterized protein n=1 Tax=Chrysochromulina tobinii TaxID=1460289 RepID=A0A0M0LQ34_9EUKA|nr:hypothetical protein Ctob_011896 [Chrysochromulina tobinii]|eukprot:KOO52848.1 hypothetical protein Ctob_011896 [Chrysochromulina sp. CCMP291]
MSARGSTGATAVNTATRARETANTVTKDFLTFSQPFIHEGALLSSSTSGRRLFIHHLSEVPLGTDVFTTQIGNQLKRTDKNTVAMGDIKLDIKPFPEGIANVPTPKIISQVPTAAFTGPAEARDKLAVQLINKGKEANSAGEFAAACACFESAYALARREGMLVSAANMRLKLGDAYTAAAMYRQLLSDPGLLDAKERDMATRKLKEAQDQPPQPPSASRAAGGVVVGAAGSASASPAEGEAVRRLEARLKALEELVRAGPSKLALEQTSQKVDSLSAQVERRLAGVKKGMGALHERLTAVELAMAKLPEHLKTFKTKNREQAQIGREHAEQIAALQKAIPALATPGPDGFVDFGSAHGSAPSGSEAPSLNDFEPPSPGGDGLVAFGNFTPAKLEAQSNSFQDSGATVTDDEFNALFGPTE